MGEKNRATVREEKTIEAMATMYCRRHHGSTKEICTDCRELLDYARERLERCRFREAKPTCARCPVHCYSPAIRERVRDVMRFAGPRMTWRHPVLAFFHFLRGLRRPQNNPPKRPA